MQAIQSCINQSYANKEIIIGDDGSNDSSIELVKSLGGDTRYSVMSRDDIFGGVIPTILQIMQLNWAKNNIASIGKAVRNMIMIY